MDNLDKDITLARKLGYGAQYGKFKADYPNTREVKPIRIIKVNPDGTFLDRVNNREWRRKN